MIRKITLSTFACLASLIFINAINKTSGGHPSSTGATGAPGEQTCARAGCHTDATKVMNSPANSFTFSDPKNTYNSNGFYSITLGCTETGKSKFGFQIVAIDSATGKNAGTWVITEASKTQVINGESPFTERKYITHTTAGTVHGTAGKAAWNFKWKAPDSNKGTIVFYYVVNATNNSNTEFGDLLNFGSQKVRFSASSISVKNPVVSKPVITIIKEGLLISTEETLNSIQILNLEGKVIYENLSIQNNIQIKLDEIKQPANSVYIYHINTDKGRFSGKFFL